MDNYDIAIVDDESYYLTEIQKIVIEYFNKRSLRVNISLFDNIIDFKNSKDIYDFIVLDININQHSGLELKKELEFENNETRIIFVTNFEGYMIESFGTNVLGFVLKDDLLRLEKIIDVYLNSGTNNKRYVILNDQKININSVLYCYALSGYVKIYYIDDDSVKNLLVNKTLIELNEILGEIQFISSHKSYIVNLLRVKKIDATDVILDFNVKVPLSRRRNTEFRNEFVKYIKNRKK